MGVCPLVGGIGSWPYSGLGCVRRCLLAQEVFRQPVCWWVRLYSCPVACMAWVISALEPAGCWVRPRFGPKVPCKVSAFRWVLPDMFVISFLYQVRTTAAPGLPRRPSKTSRSDPGAYGVTALVLGLCALGSLCALPKSGVCLCPSLVELLQSSPTSLQSQMLLGPPPLDVRPPGWGVWCGARPSFLWDNFCDKIFSSLWAAHRGMIWLYH